jgi:hypothetical protein
MLFSAQFVVFIYLFIYFISLDETELCKTDMVIRDFKPSVSKSDFIFSCEGFPLLHPFDTQISVHNAPSAEFDGVVALPLSAAVAVYCQCDDCHRIHIS